MIHKITAKQWDAMLAVHCTAPFRLIQVQLLSQTTYLGVSDAQNAAVCPIIQRPTVRTCTDDTLVFTGSCTCYEGRCQEGAGGI